MLRSDFIRYAQLALITALSDRAEFIAAASKMLLTQKTRSLTPLLDAAAHGLNHWMCGLTYKGEPLRLRCRDEREWLEMRASIFPTREQRLYEINAFQKRLGLPLVDDGSEVDLKRLRHEKHDVQKTCVLLRSERESVQLRTAKSNTMLSFLNKARAALEAAHTPKGANLDAAALKKLASGCKWLKIGDAQPADARDLARHDLADALTCKTEFTQEEWDKFSVPDLCLDHFVKVRGSYFRPVGIDDLLKDVASLGDRERALEMKLAELEPKLEVMAERTF